MQSSKVVVGVTTKNRAPILGKAIDSALEQSYPLTQIVVLDDGSTDTTCAVLDGYPQIIRRRHLMSYGIIESRNELMQSAAADYYLSLDDDAWFLDHDEISLAVRVLDQDPNAAAVAFDILSPDRDAVREREAPYDVGTFVGCGHLVRLAAARQAGFYSKTPGAYGSEERDLSLRLLDLGYSIRFLPGVHVWHDKAWSGRDWFPLHRSGVCNELMMITRRCPYPDVLVVLPLKLLSFCRFWINKPAMFRAGMAGLWIFSRNIVQALKSRRAVKRSAFYFKARFDRPHSSRAADPHQSGSQR